MKDAAPSKPRLSERAEADDLPRDLPNGSKDQETDADSGEASVEAETVEITRQRVKGRPFVRMLAVAASALLLAMIVRILRKSLYVDGRTPPIEAPTPVPDEKLTGLPEVSEEKSEESKADAEVEPTGSLKGPEEEAEELPEKPKAKLVPRERLTPTYDPEELTSLLLDCVSKLLADCMANSESVLKARQFFKYHRNLGDPKRDMLFVGVGVPAAISSSSRLSSRPHRQSFWTALNVTKAVDALMVDETGRGQQRARKGTRTAATCSALHKSEMHSMELQPDDIAFPAGFAALVLTFLVAQSCCRAVPPHSLCVRGDSGDDEVLMYTTKVFAAALQQPLQQLLKQQPLHHEQQHQQTGRPFRVEIVKDAAAANEGAAFERAIYPLSLLLQLQLQLVVASAVLLLRAAGPRLKALRLVLLMWLSNDFDSPQYPAAPAGFAVVALPAAHAGSAGAAKAAAESLVLMLLLPLAYLQTMQQHHQLLLMLRLSLREQDEVFRTLQARLGDSIRRSKKCSSNNNGKRSSERKGMSAGAADETAAL
ncbi:hypothetical protein Emed_006183 [Eimeria media]